MIVAPFIIRADACNFDRRLDLSVGEILFGSNKRYIEIFECAVTSDITMWVTEKIHSAVNFICFPRCLRRKLDNAQHNNNEEKHYFFILRFLIC